MNLPDLERAAEESHGRFYTLADAQRLPDELPTGTRVTVNAPGPPWLVWNHAALFLTALLLLSTEWQKWKNIRSFWIKKAPIWHRSLFLEQDRAKLEVAESMKRL